MGATFDVLPEVREAVGPDVEIDRDGYLAMGLLGCRTVKELKERAPEILLTNAASLRARVASLTARRRARCCSRACSRAATWRTRMGDDGALVHAHTIDDAHRIGATLANRRAAARYMYYADTCASSAA